MPGGLPGAPSLMPVTDRDEVRARFAERVEAIREDALTIPDRDAVRNVLTEYVRDSCTVDEVRDDIRHSASFSRFGAWRLRQALLSFESFMADPPLDGTMMWLVAGYGDWEIDGASEEDYAGFLREVLQILREEVVEAEARQRFEA